MQTLAKNNQRLGFVEDELMPLLSAKLRAARAQLGRTPACCLYAMSWIVPATAAVAASERSIHELRIQSQPLDAALQELARQSGFQVVFFSRIAEGRSAPELSGEYTLPAAMSRLLEGSDLTFRWIDARTIEVRKGSPRPARLPRESPRSTSWSAPADGPMQEVKVTATVEQLVATRIPTPLRDIPQSISIISEEQIRQQNAFDLGDVLERTPGISIRRSNSLDESAFSRAYEVISFQVDAGGPVKPWITGQVLYSGSPDLSEFDRVEVLRGSDALFSGNSSPGGRVSLVRKRPLATPSFAVTATWGSWNNFRTELDATGPLTKDGALRGRADVMYHTREFFYDHAHQNRKKVFGVLEYDLTPTSMLTAGGSYQWDDALPFSNGLPLYSDARDAELPRNTSFVFDWAYYSTRASRVYLQYQQQFADDWILRLNTSAARSIVDFGWAAFGSRIDTRTHTLGTPAAAFSMRPDRFTVGTLDATLTGTFHLFGLQQTLAIGGDFTRVRSWRSAEAYVAFGEPLTDVLAFDPASYPDPRLTRPPDLWVATQQVHEQYGGFLSLQVDLNAAFSITGGGRVASNSLRVDSELGVGDLHFPGLTSDLGTFHVFQPYGALMYRINDNLSWYASYADVYRALDGVARRSDGSLLGPMHGITMESGIKGAWRGGALNASVAIYQIEQRHTVLATDERSALDNCCHETGTGRGRGGEIEIGGMPTPRWLVGGGYAYNVYRMANRSIPTTSTPRHLLKLWTSATLPGALSRWTVGGNLHAQAGVRGNAHYSAADSRVLEARAIRSYAVLDLRTGYEIDPNWQVALNVNNVLDKRYYVSQNTPYYYLWYGEPRSLMFRVDARF